MSIFLFVSYKDFTLLTISKQIDMSEQTVQNVAPNQVLQYLWLNQRFEDISTGNKMEFLNIRVSMVRSYLDILGKYGIL